MLRSLPFLRCQATTTKTPLFSLQILQFHSTNLDSPNPNSNPHTSTTISTDLLNYSRSGFRKVDDALVMFDEMLKLKPALPVINFNQLLSGLVKIKQYALAVSLFTDMCYLRVPVNLITFSIAMNCCCYCGRIDYAFSLLAGIIKRGFVPDAFVFNVIIRGVLSQGKVKEAEGMFRKLVRLREIQPDVVTFTTMINGMAKTGNASMALWLFSYMEENGCEPNSVTYATVIDSLCKRGLVDEALKLHSKMVQKGILPDIYTYTPIIQGLCKADKQEEAAQLLKNMFDDMNISPNAWVFNILVDAYSKAGKLEDVKRTIQIMEKRGIYPDIITYNSLLEAYCLQGQIDDAFAVLKTMASKKIIPDCITYNILLHGLCQVGRPVEALTFFYKVRGQGHMVDSVAYKTLLDGLFKNQDADRALSFFHVMKCNGEVLNKDTYNIVIRGCIRNKKYNEACGLIDKMVDCGISADASTISLLQILLSVESQDPTLIALHQKCMQSGM